MGANGQRLVGCDVAGGGKVAGGIENGVKELERRISGGCAHDLFLGLDAGI